MKRRPTFFDRVELAAARLLFSLPTGTLAALSGRPIQLDGNTLHPEMQAMIVNRKRMGAPASLADLPLDAARRNMLRDSTLYEGAQIAVHSVRDFELPRAIEQGGPLPVRHYAPEPRAAAAGPRPLLVFFHGGGYALGDLDTHDMPCRFLCKHANVHVLSVDYRRSPDHMYPAAAEDGVFALRWAQTHATELGADPTRVAVGGDSAGGNLSAGTALRALEKRGQGPVLQLLIYPATDRLTPRPSWELFGKDFFLTRADMEFFDTSYFGGGASMRADPGVSPMFSNKLGAVCPALVVTAGFDVLRDEGEAYAEKLAASGVKVEVWREPQLMHGFINMAGISRHARAALTTIADKLRVSLG